MTTTARRPLPSVWAVSDGKIGDEVKAVGLAEALGLEPAVKRLRVRFPWRQVAPYVRFAMGWAAGRRGDQLRPPWPDIIISVGKPAIAPSLAAKQQSRGRICLIHIGDPAIDLGFFDLVIAPRHDKARGPNVVLTTGSVHRVTPARLAAAAARHGPRLDALPRPRVAVLIGGDTKLLRLTPAIVTTLAGQLRRLAAEGWGLMVTTSRRTGAENEAILRRELAGLPAELWTGGEDNPYYAYLALAEAVIVTADSVNMVSEAAVTGRPIHVVDLEGDLYKFATLHGAMREAGVTRPFTGTLERWTYAPADEMPAIAAAVRERLAGFGLALPPPSTGGPAITI